MRVSARGFRPPRPLFFALDTAVAEYRISTENQRRAETFQGLAELGTTAELVQQ